jgi:hypothetical protein
VKAKQRRQKKNIAIWLASGAAFKFRSLERETLYTKDRDEADRLLIVALGLGRYLNPYRTETSTVALTSVLTSLASRWSRSVLACLPDVALVIFLTNSNADYCHCGIEDPTYPMTLEVSEVRPYQLRHCE